MKKFDVSVLEWRTLFDRSKNIPVREIIVFLDYEYGEMLDRYFSRRKNMLSYFLRYNFIYKFKIRFNFMRYFGKNKNKNINGVDPTARVFPAFNSILLRSFVEKCII